MIILETISIVIIVIFFSTADIIIIVILSLSLDICHCHSLFHISRLRERLHARMVFCLERKCPMVC